MMLIKSKYLDRIFSLALPSSTKVDFMNVTVKDLQNVTTNLLDPEHNNSDLKFTFVFSKLFRWW